MQDTTGRKAKASREVWSLWMEERGRWIDIWVTGREIESFLNFYAQCNLLKMVLRDGSYSRGVTMH